MFNNKAKQKGVEIRPGRVWGYLFWSVLVVGLLGVLARCGHLQYYESEYYQEKANRQQLKIIPQSARRGLILDRAGRVLATSVKIPSVCLDPSLIEDPVHTAIILAEALDMDADAIYEELQKNQDKRFMWVRRFVSNKQAQRIQEHNLPGVLIQQEYQRSYPMGKLAAHVLGFTDIDGKGLEGVERQYDEYLRGKPGKMILRKDVRQRPIGSLGPCTPGEDGNNVVLSIDAVIQACVEKELDKVVEKFQAKGALAIVMEPDSGEVLALANWPGFDPAVARQCAKKLLRNQALTDPYEPGSTFKPFTVAAALQGKYVTLNQKIDCLEGPYVGKGFGRIPEYKHYFGMIPVADILIRSSNIGAAKLGQKMGGKYYYKMIEKFGFGTETGIDLPGEGAGIPQEKTGTNGEKITLSEQLQDRYGPGYTLTRVAYGQTIAVTPIQLIRGFCSLVNGGLLVKPRVMRGIIDTNGKIIKDAYTEVSFAKGKEQRTKSEKPDRIISEKVSRDLVTKALVGVVARQGGTAHKAHLDEWCVFGKTGTAQVPKKDGRGYESGKYKSSFIAGAPAGNPRVCVLVVVQEPDRSLGLGYTGGAVAAPVVKEILHRSLAYLEIPKTEKKEVMVAQRK